MVAPVGRAINTLEVFSLAPTVPLPYGDITEDVRLLCRVVGADPARIRGDLEVLRARNLVEVTDWRTHEVWRVIPPKTRWTGRREEWNRLGPLAIQVLTSTAKTNPYQRTGSDWDALAAQVAQWNADAGFRLLLAHLRDGGRSAALFLHHARMQLLHALSEIDRPRLVRALVGAAAEGPRAFEVQFELPVLLRPVTDTLTLVQLIDEGGRTKGATNRRPPGRKPGGLRPGLRGVGNSVGSR